MTRSPNPGDIESSHLDPGDIPTWMKLDPQTLTAATQCARWTGPPTGKEKVQSAAGFFLIRQSAAAFFFIGQSAEAKEKGGRLKQKGKEIAVLGKIQDNLS